MWLTITMVVGEAPRDAEVGNSGTGADFPGSRLKQRVMSKRRGRSVFQKKEEQGCELKGKKKEKRQRTQVSFQEVSFSRSGFFLLV